MKSNLPKHIWASRSSFKVSLLFALLACCLQVVNWFYWGRILEPRLRREAASQANVLAHSQAMKVAEVLASDTSEKRFQVLKETLNEVLLFTEPETGVHFFNGIELEVDYETIQAPYGSLDLNFGVKNCLNCFVSEVALYSPHSDELLGIAHFKVSNTLFKRLTKDVKRTLFIQSLLGLFLLLGVWVVTLVFVREINRSRQQAEVANKTKSAFLANMSHELRTPLNAIIGFSQMMSHDSGFLAKHRKNLSIINRSGEYLLELINDILELSRIEAGRSTLVVTSFDLYDSLDKVAEMIRLRAESKHLQLVVERPETVPRYIKTDERKLRQILLNLLGNAVKFTEKGGVVLRVRIQDDQQQGSKERNLCFEVEDSGPGISPAEQEKIFEAFTQASSGANKKEGAGLGLAISRQFVRHLGGNIEIKSEVGTGTIFRFTIRAQAGQCAEVESVRCKQCVIGVKVDSGKENTYRIMVVDDHRDNRVLLKQLLEDTGFTVLEAENGEQAVEHCLTGKPHLIWMDMRMPVMDGYEATRIIRERTSSWNKDAQPVIIALTASAFEEDRAAVLEAGCHDFVRRPFHEDEIFKIIHQYLGLELIYQHEEAQSALSGDSAWISPEHLQAAASRLPDRMIRDLRSATELSDMHQIDQIVHEIKSIDEGLANSLKNLVDTFQYDRILELLDRAEKPGRKEANNVG